MVKETPTVSRKSFNQMLEMNANRLTRLDSAPKVEWGDYLEHQLRKLGVVDRLILRRNKQIIAKNHVPKRFPAPRSSPTLYLLWRSDCVMKRA